MLCAAHPDPVEAALCANVAAVVWFNAALQA
jgi:hypothetical protein